MATTEQQPLKKQKLYNPPPPPPENSPLPPPPPPQTSSDEALKNRRNKEEIRNLYECFKQIKLCVVANKHNNDSDIEQAYLSLITASRGCSSVQRLVADLIPRYASYCPTALEAAAKVTINLHNWSLAVINRGEDFDNVAFETAKACIFGLVDICKAASSVTPTSSVIQGIYSEVFINVLMFLLPCLEGKDIFQIVDLDFLKIQESEDFFSEIKKTIPDKDESSLIKLCKLSAICLLRIFFCYPSSLLSACFELFDPTKQRAEKGLIFLRQVTSIFDTKNVSHCVDGIEGTHDAKKCLLGLVFMKDHSLRSLISSKYKRLCRSASSETVLEVERALKPFTNMLKLEDRDLSSERDDSDPSRIIRRHNSMPRHNTHEAFPEIYGRSKTQNGYGNKKFAENFPGPFLKRHSSLITRETDLSNNSPSYDCGGFKCTNVDSWDHEDIPHRRSSTPRDLNKNQILSPVSRKPSEFRSNSFDHRAHLNLLEQNQAHNLDRTSSAFHSSPANENIDQVQWYSDGDPAAMDIFSACNQIWVGSLGPESSESLVKYRFEKFGPVEQFLHFPYKDFALVEYRYLMDAIRARRIMRGQSPWGSSLRIKFLDRGLGSKGYSNNVAIGSSCQVYIGNIQSRWAKNDILQDVRNVFHKGPRMVTDLNSENALLFEFDTPEEASHVMGHLRHRRKDIISPRPTFSRDTLKRNDLGENSVESPRARDLSSLLSSLRDKYNINHCSEVTREEDHSPTNTLLIRILNSPQSPNDDEIKAVCDISIGNLGSIIKLVHANIHMGSGWFVECSSVDIAKALLKNLQDCSKNFFQIQFSQSGMQHSTAPISHQENHANGQGGPIYQKNYPSFTSTGTPEVGTERTNGSNNLMVKNPVNGGNHVISGPTEQPWMYRQTDQSVVPPPPPSQSFQTTPYPQPLYYPQYGSWDGRSYPHHHPYIVPNTPHHNSVAPTFVPTSVAPLSQISGNSFQNPSHIYPPPPVSAQPQPPHQPQPSFAPPPPPSSPPPQPPSPPPQPLTQYQWQGALSKSGAHYCTIFAQRVEVESCKYSYATSEPSEWPAKLDMTKRTDFRHVKSTFNSTLPHKRELCWLFPSSDGDHKGFQDFNTYLKQRQCAGVFKIPATKSMWARLLFILPCSEEILSLLSITSNQSECLIALVLPKETELV